MAKAAKAIAIVLLILLPSLSFGGGEGEQYQKYCGACHGTDKLGVTASPLLPQLLTRYSDERLTSIIRKGLPATQMPSWPDMNDDEVKAIISYIRKPVTVKWTTQDIEKSITLQEVNPVRIESFKRIHNIKDITAVVERGNDSVWIMTGDRMVDSFKFGNVHGGGKFDTKGTMFFLPSRDGWVAKYNLTEERYVGKVRPCVNLRNISLSNDGKHVLAACLIPQNIFILDTATLKPVKTIENVGKISAIYEQYSSDKAIFTTKDKPQIGLLDTATFNVEYIKTEVSFEDFFIDPLERYIVGSSREKSLLVVLDLKTKKTVFEHKIESMPHLASASFWYDKGDFYFATPHILKPYISLWKMYNWGFVKNIDIGGEGFFVRTTPASPYLWMDNGTDTLTLIDKKTLALKYLTPRKGKKATHTEFSGDGKIAYISIFEQDGSLVLYDSATLKELKSFKANLPVGKYNFVHKSRWYEKYQLGRELYMEKCWGCHHTTSEAFGPAFSKIVRERPESIIRQQLTDPAVTAKKLGYKRSVMPKIDLKPEELDVLMRFVEEFKKSGEDAQDN